MTYIIKLWKDLDGIPNIYDIKGISRCVYILLNTSSEWILYSTFVFKIMHNSPHFETFSPYTVINRG